MEVIALIDRTIDGAFRRAGQRFDLPDDTDLIAKGVVSDPNASAAQLEVAEHPTGWVGRFPKDAPAYTVEIKEGGAGAPRRSLASSKSNAKRKPLA